MTFTRLLLFTLVFMSASSNIAATDLKPFDPESATLEELTAYCDAAREKLLAPLRQKEIDRCKADKRNDPAYCDRFWASFGESHINNDGEFVPRQFSDIPECVTADKERRRRVRG